MMRPQVKCLHKFAFYGVSIVWSLFYLFNYNKDLLTCSRITTMGLTLVQQPRGEVRFVTPTYSYTANTGCTINILIRVYIVYLNR